jgi:hypothetical protein
MATVPAAASTPDHREHLVLALATAALGALLAGYVGGLSGAATGPYPTQPVGSAPMHDAPPPLLPSPTPGPPPGL